MSSSFCWFILHPNLPYQQRMIPNFSSQSSYSIFIQGRTPPLTGTSLTFKPFVLLCQKGWCRRITSLNASSRREATARMRLEVDVKCRFWNEPQWVTKCRLKQKRYHTLVESINQTDTIFHTHCANKWFYTYHYGVYLGVQIFYFCLSMF